MKVLITGATGFIGKKLGTELTKKGYALNILTRSASKAAVPFECQIYEWNPTKGQLPQAALEGVSAVINLAGTSIAEKRWSPSAKVAILESRLQSVSTLWSGLQYAPAVQTFISSSAIGIYGDSGDQIVDEASAPGSGFLAEVCKQWEHAVFSVPNKIRKVAMRTGFVLGHGGALEKMLPIFKLGLGGALGSGHQWMSWIHIEDLVKLFIFALENSGVEGPVNAVAPNPVTNSDFTKILAETLHRPAVFHVPSLVLKLALGEMSQLLLESQRVSSQQIESLGFSFQFSDLKPALKDLLS